MNNEAASAVLAPAMKRGAGRKLRLTWLALHLTAIPLRFEAAGELDRYTLFQSKIISLQ